MEKIMDPEVLMEGLLKELTKAVQAMSKAKSVEEKLEYSKIVYNLSKSLDVFFNIISDFVDMGDDLEEF
ncbi:MAG: hypothetical protein DSZ23_03965 [Thermodesulfatator sp.]|nr:MAG: hypothetical protein DSZ23_03965 [Thermodesulfatator sp.]